MNRCLLCGTAYPTWHSLIGHLLLDHNLETAQARIIAGPPSLEQMGREWGKLEHYKDPQTQ